MHLFLLNNMRYKINSQMSCVNEQNNKKKTKGNYELKSWNETD